MYLVDTNIWLERLLDQEQSEVIGRFLEQVPSDQLAVTDFALHSIGIILCRLGLPDAFRLFVHEVFIDGAVMVIHLEPTDMPGVLEAMEQFNLDFDDAYQYVAAEKHALTLLSLDADFDRTPAGRKTPQQIVT
ncbi:type II toxin-antitoxin system VapC family toxin [Thermoflexus sp.]|uniref:type II toxin-antitoxin system VapC family toxin n=1 Tax=Thermoflexus sp. TaxID=1969742 RepID=UPI0035E3F49D